MPPPKPERRSLRRRPRPAGWPRYMSDKRLASGATAYFWSPQSRDRNGGCTVAAEALGTDYGIACARADLLNLHLDAWRRAAVGEAPVPAQRLAAIGTLDWLVDRYQRSGAWERKVSPRSRPEYVRALRMVCDVRRKSGLRVGEAQCSAIDAEAVDLLYAKLKQGPRGPRTRQAVLCVQRMARAWDVVRRLHKALVPADNPWRGVDLEHGGGVKPAATRDEAWALHRALVEAGEPHLAAVPLICFEWHQRPENILAGLMTWADIEPPGRAGFVRIRHGKTGAEGFLPLTAADDDGAPLELFPELMAYLATLPRLGVPVVLARPRVLTKGGERGVWIRGQARPFKLRHARELVRAAADAAGLPTWLTLDACRHGGMTELGDAEVTEAGIMSLSQHKTPDAARRYIKRTETQRRLAAARRRAWVEQARGDGDAAGTATGGGAIPTPHVSR